MTYVHAAAADKEFAKRLNQIERRHSKLSKGYLMSVNHDGLVVARPHRKRPSFPFRGLMITAIAVIGFKAFALAYLGAASYQDRIDRLSTGTTSERMAAWVMRTEPATRAVAGVVAPYLR
jgi:hypothetical protein